MVSFLSANFLIWAWDLTHASNREKYVQFFSHEVSFLYCVLFLHFSKHGLLITVVMSQCACVSVLQYCLDRHESASQMAYQLVQPFLHSLPMYPTLRQTHAHTGQRL